MRLEEARDYLRRSGDLEIAPDCLEIDGHGFASFRSIDGYLVIHQCYGDGKFWANLARDMAKDKGLKGVMFTTRRNPKAFERRHGAKIVGYLMELPLWEA